jgi:hypothetical protein
MEYGPVAPKQVIEFMGSDDDASSATIYNALSRMVRANELVRGENGYEVQPVRRQAEGRIFQAAGMSGLAAATMLAAERAARRAG